MSNETRTPSPKTAFISGPMEPGVDYFQEHYELLIRDAISAGDSFVMGPAPGMDTMALHFLLEEKVHPSRITVYLAEFQEISLRDLKKWFEGLGGNIKVEGVTTSDRDAAMTRDSDYDILRYMSVEEQKKFYGARYFPRVSATEKNERRRLGLPLHVNHANELEIQPKGPISRNNTPFYITGGSKGGDLLSKWKQGIRNWRKVTQRTSVEVTDDFYSFLLPAHKADQFFEGNRIIIRTNQFRHNPLNHFLEYLHLRDSAFPMASPLWLTETGNIPTQSFFISRLRRHFTSDVAGHSMRAGGATSLAKHGTPPSIIQAIGRWSGDSFQACIRKNPVLIQVLLFARNMTM